MNQYLYVCHFSNGHIKVGRSVHPQSRIASHAERVACFGIELVEHYIVECTGHGAPAETKLIGHCSGLASKRHKSEWFEGLEYLDICEFANACATQIHPIGSVSRITEIIRKFRSPPFSFSQAEITRRTGISQSRISRWENGDVAAGADDALKLVELEIELQKAAA